MSDVFGALQLPAPAPAARPDLPTNLTVAQASLTDPALDTVLSFIAAVLNAQLSTAWAIRSPAPQKNQPARLTFLSTNDPREGEFLDDQLPGLFLYRYQLEDTALYAADAPATTEVWRLDWVFPPDAQHKERVRNNIINGLIKSLVLACEQGRHPAWTVGGDNADPDAIKTSIATSTSLQTYTGAALNGAVGSGTVIAARLVSVTTAAAALAYNVTDPIVVTGTLDNGITFVDYITLTNTNGGETVTSSWNFATVTSIEVPAQLLTTGAFQFGHAVSPEKEYGSPLRRHAGLTQFRCSGARRVQFEIKMGKGAAARAIRKADMQYDAVQFEFRVQEVFAADVTGGTVLGQVDDIGIDNEYAYPDGSGDLFSEQSLT